MNIEEIKKQQESSRKVIEYEMKITKMAGYLSDYYIDRAIETDDFSYISSFLIDYFSGYVGKSFDIGYLVAKYKEFGLNEKIEDIDFDMNEWYAAKYDIDNIRKVDPEENIIMEMPEDEYILYMIEKRKSEKNNEEK